MIFLNSNQKYENPILIKRIYLRFQRWSERSSHEARASSLWRGPNKKPHWWRKPTSAHHRRRCLWLKHEPPWTLPRLSSFADRRTPPACGGAPPAPSLCYLLPPESPCLDRNFFGNCSKWCLLTVVDRKATTRCACGWLNYLSCCFSPSRAKRARKATTYIRYQIYQQSFKKSTPFFLSPPKESQECGIGCWLLAAGCYSVLGLLVGSPKRKL